MRYYRLYASRILGIFVIVVTLLNGCAARQPVRIGFNGELSGRNATIGVQGRNGALLAVEEINRKGGINGRPLELVVRDNQGSPERVAEINRAFIKDGMFVVTGHMTSMETLAARPLVEHEKVILFSPSTGSPQFSHIDDNFFRIIPDISDKAYPLAEFAYLDLGLRRVAVVYDQDNPSYTVSYSEAFLRRFGELGGEKAGIENFSSRQKPDFAPLVRKIRATSPDLLLALTSSVDTALIAQHARIQGWDIPIVASTWAYTEDLIRNGGAAVEGIYIATDFPAACTQETYMDFQESFRDAFGKEPAFVAALSYETIQVLALALEGTGGQSEGLKEALLTIHNFQGLCGAITMDRYGDALRSVHLISVRDGRFIDLKTFAPSPES
jgi:branched-chain amino acid transport system substrate-binding protein